MTASLFNSQNGSFGNVVDGIVYPQFLTANRAPTSTDIYPPGTRWLDSSVNPRIIYVTSGAGDWDTGGVQPATTTTYGTVLLTDNSEPVATKVYADNLAIAGSPVSTITVAGIGQLATDAEAIAGTASTPALALFVTPSNLSPVFGSPPAIGGTLAAAGSFTTLDASSTLDVTGLSTLSGSATILSAGTAINIGSDASSDAINVGTGAAARTITIGNVTGATAVAISTGTGSFGVTTTGTGDIVLNSDDTVLIDADGVLELNSSAGVISVGNDADNQNINIGSAGTRTIQVGSATATLNLFSGSGINLGTNTDQQPIVIGNQTGNTSVTIDSGTGVIDIGTAIAKTITIGNTTGASAVNVEVGTGNFSLDGVAGSTYTVGASTTTGTIDVGGTAQTGNMTLGSSSGTNALRIANGTGATTLSLAVNQTAGAINAGTAMTTGTISIGGTGAHTGTISIAPGTGAQTLNIANSTGGKTVNVATGAGANAVTIGSTNSTSATTIQAGSGGVNLTGDVNLTAVATKISLNGGAATDFIGTSVLVAGTVTIANTNIAANDRIFLSRTAVNASTTLGELTYSISAGASFTVTSAVIGTPGSTETGDLSSFSYIIFRQT